MEERGLGAGQLQGSGKDGRITKGDVLEFLSRPAAAPAATHARAAAREPEPGEERVRMTRLRRTIAQRLKEAQNTAAMLTTFNEVDMSAAMALRAEYRDAFEKKHGGVRLGFMSFFVRACVAGAEGVPGRQRRDRRRRDRLQELRPHGHRGRRRERARGAGAAQRRQAWASPRSSSAIADFGKRARDGQLKLDELSGGTFTISNGGVYGSR